MPVSSAPPRHQSCNILHFFVVLGRCCPFAGCIVSLMIAVTSVACTKSEEDVATIIGLIGAILGKKTQHSSSSRQCFFREGQT